MFAGAYNVLGRRNTLAQGLPGNGRVLDPRNIPGLQLMLDADTLNGSLGYRDAVSSWADLSGNDYDAAQSTGSAQPFMLPWSGTNYLHQVAVSGNGASVPDSAALSITSGLLSYRHRCALVSYATGSTQQLGTKWNSTGDQRSYSAGVDGSGQLFFQVSTGGTSASASSVTGSGASLSANVEYWFRYDWEDGAVSLYYAPAAADEPTVWTAVGSGTAGTSIFDGTAEFVVAVFGGLAAGHAAGRHYRSILYHNGAKVLDIDFNRGNGNSSSFAASTGQTVTINRSGANPATIVSWPTVRFDGTDDFLGLSSGLGMFRNVPGATVVALAGYATAATRRLLEAAVGTGNGGRVSVGINSSEYVVAGRRSDADTIASILGGSTSANTHVSQAARINYASALAANFVNGSLVGSESAFQTAGSTSDTDSTAIRIGSAVAGANFHAGDITRLAVFNRALNTSELRRVNQWAAAITRGVVSIA